MCRPSRNSILRRIYYYPSFSLAAVYTALQHFKELISARYPLTSPGLSVANVDQCLAKGHYSAVAGLEPRTWWSTVRRRIHSTTTPPLTGNDTNRLLIQSESPLTLSRPIIILSLPYLNCHILHGTHHSKVNILFSQINYQWVHRKIFTSEIEKRHLQRMLFSYMLFSFYSQSVFVHETCEHS